MRLSLVFELLLIFVLLAFAASRVIDSKGLRNSHRAVKRKHGKISHKNRQDVNKYCSCSTKLCNCCREFNIPVVAFQGPGCATLQYLQGDRLAISMSFGERILTNTTISGRKPKPVCMPLPGGVSKFCGRVYNIGRQGEDFKACLGLELRALQDIEASLRVSCFRFGPRGLKVEPAQPLPVVVSQAAAGGDDDDDDDDDDDYYGFDDDDDYDVDNDVDSVDYSAFSVFDEDFVGGLFGDDSDSDDVPQRKPVKKVVAAPTKAPARKNTRKPTRAPTKVRKPKPAVKKTTTSKPPTVQTTATKKLTSATTARTVMIPVVTVASEKKPEVPNVKVNSVTSSQSQVQPSVGSVLSSPHESIAAVTAMLQNLPGDLPQVPPIDVKSATIVSELAPSDSHTSSPAPSTITTIASVASETMTDANMKITTEQPLTATTLETTIQGITQTITEAFQTYETTTISDDLGTTELFPTTTDEDEEENSTELVENLLLRNNSDDVHDIDDDDNEEDDDDDDDDEDDDDDDEGSFTDPLSSAVAHVLGDDDDDDAGKKEKLKKINIIKKLAKKGTKTKKEPSMLDDIVDGVMETITGEEVSDAKPGEHDDDDDDADDAESDEDDSDNDDDEDENNENVDDEDEARKTGSKQTSRSRQSKDMWLDRLHWQ